MAVTTGNVTIKPAGGTYTTWANFWNDVGDLTGDLTCTVSDGTNPVGAATAVSFAMGGHTLHVLPETFPTKTDASTGSRITFNTLENMLSLDVTGAGTVIIEGMVLLQGTRKPGRGLDVGAEATDVILRRNIVKGCDEGIRWQPVTTGSVSIYNNIVYDSGFAGLSIWRDDTTALVANNTLVHCGYNVWAGDEEVTFINTLAYGAVAADYINIELLTNGYNNADSDGTGADGDWGGTGSDNVTGISDPFNAIGSDDFTITAEGDVGTAGLDKSADFTDDFFGVTRVNWTIGACEFIPPPTSQAVGDGAITPAGSLGLATSISLSGGTTPAGALNQNMAVAFTGATAPAGVLGLLTDAQPAGGLTMSGVLNLKTSITPLGAITPAGVLGRSIMVDFTGAITPSGALNQKTVIAFTGSATPSGALGRALQFPITITGALTPIGALTRRNPNWLLIDDTMHWMGEWATTYPYDLDDVVLYKATGAAEWHVFVSKITHNTGNIPTSSASAWRRLYQEPLE